MGAPKKTAEKKAEELKQILSLENQFIEFIKTNSEWKEKFDALSKLSDNDKKEAAKIKLLGKYDWQIIKGHNARGVKGENAGKSAIVFSVNEILKNLKSYSHSELVSLQDELSKLKKQVENRIIEKANIEVVEAQNKYLSLLKAKAKDALTPLEKTIIFELEKAAIVKESKE